MLISDFYRCCLIYVNFWQNQAVSHCFQGLSEEGNKCRTVPFIICMMKSQTGVSLSQSLPCPLTHAQLILARFFSPVVTDANTLLMQQFHQQLGAIICDTLCVNEPLFRIGLNVDCITLLSSTFCRKTDFTWGFEQGKSNKAAVTLSPQNLRKRDGARERVMR